MAWDEEAFTTSKVAFDVHNRRASMVFVRTWPLDTVTFKAMVFYAGMVGSQYRNFVVPNFLC